jgi:hypothetical protein
MYCTSMPEIGSGSTSPASSTVAPSRVTVAVMRSCRRVSVT